jgi:hypothetical protein
MMKYLKFFLIIGLLISLVAEDADARRRRSRRRGRSKLYSPPTKFEMHNRKASFEVKKDKMILTFDGGRIEEPIPFQTKSDKVAGMAYIPLGGRDFIQMVVWVVDVKGNIGPGSKFDRNSEDVGQLLYWDLYEIVDNKIIWRQHQLLDQFMGQADQQLPPHMENAIQLAVDDGGKVFFRRGAVEEFISVE